MYVCSRVRSTAFFEGYLKRFGKKWGILIKRESESLDFTGLKIPRDYIIAWRTIMDLITIIFLTVMTVLGVVGLCINSKYIKIIGLIILILTFSYICSVRNISSADTKTYLYYYNQAANINEIKFGFGREYFPWIENWFINICWLFNKLHFQFSQFLFIIALAFNTLSCYALTSIFKEKYSFERKISFVFIVILLFFVNYGFLYSYVVIRGGLSFVFCLLAYSCSLKKYRIKTIVFMIIAIAVHNYSTVFLLIFVLYKIKFKKNHMKFFMSVFIILLIMNIFRIDVVFTKMITKIGVLFTGDLLQVSHYLLDAEETTSLKKGILLYLMQNVYLVYLFYNMHDKKITNDFAVLLTGSILAALINDNAVIRITNYFFVFQVFLYGRYLTECYVLKNLRKHTTMTREMFANIIIIAIVLPVTTFVYMLRYCSII